MPSSLEQLVLDGLALNDSSTFDLLEFEALPPAQRPDWISAADSEWAALLRDPFYENRIVTCKLAIRQQTTVDLALDKIGQIRDKLAKASKTTDGIALAWTPANSTRTVTFDVLAGNVSDLPITPQSGWFQRAPTVTIELTCKPFWRGTETLTSPATTSTPFVTLEVANVPGDAPALGRLIITDPNVSARRHVEWGLENQYYVAGGSQSLLLDSDNLTTTGFAGAGATRTGAYDPNATGNNVVRITLAPFNSAVVGTGNQPHVGTFKVKARVYYAPTGTYAGAASVRFSWQAGSGSFTANDWATPTIINDFSELDLGYITIPPVTAGTQRWTGRVEAKTTATGDVLDVDYLILIPVLEGYGKIRAVYRDQPGALVARDEFTSIVSGSALNGRVAPSGGTWATSGSTTDFSGGAVIPDTVQRATVSDASARLAILGTTNYADTNVLVDFQNSSLTGVSGTIARYVDASNYLWAQLHWDTFWFVIYQSVAGTVTQLNAVNVPGIAVNTVYQIRLIAYATGYVIAQLVSDNGTVLGQIGASSSAVVTGGALATGKPGIRDQNASATAATRIYGGLFAATPAAEPVAINLNQSLEIRSTETLMEDGSGTYYGSPPSYVGSRFIVPTGTSRVIAKARRGDVDMWADGLVTDSTTIQVAYTPRGLVVPR